MRDLSGASMLGDIKAAVYKMTGIHRIAEDDAGGTSTANIASGDSKVGGDNAIILRRSTAGNDEMLPGSKGFKGKATNQVTDTNIPKFMQRFIKKRKRKFKAIKYRAPSHMKVA
jgi:hypothetical protein